MQLKLRSSDKSITQDLAGIIQEIYNYVCSCSTSKTSTNNDAYIRKRLKLNEDDHEVVISIYWLLEDTNLAVGEFFNYQLQGPTRLKSNLGEKYLRLYGILNAVNLQKSAIERLYELFKISGKKVIKKKLNDLDAISLRHKIGAHPIDHLTSQTIKNYRISRFTIDSNQSELHILNKEEFEKYDLEVILNEFEKFFHKELFEICVKIIRKIVPKNSAIEIELNNRMNLINERIKGNIVIESPGMTKPIIVSFE